PYVLLRVPASPMPHVAPSVPAVTFYSAATELYLRLGSLLLHLSAASTAVLHHGGAETKEKKKASFRSAMIPANFHVPGAQATKESSPGGRGGALRALRRKYRVTEKTDPSALPKSLP